MGIGEWGDERDLLVGNGHPRGASCWMMRLMWTVFHTNMAKTSWLFVTFDTAGEVIFTEANPSATQLSERVSKREFVLISDFASSITLVNTEGAFYPPRMESARRGPAGGSSGTCYPAISLQLPGASASSHPCITKSDDDPGSRDSVG
jgi:hypothetical protein